MEPIHLAKSNLSPLKLLSNTGKLLGVILKLVNLLFPTYVNPLSGADVYRVKDEAKNTISFLKLYTEDSAAQSAHELLGQTNLKGNSYDVSSPQTIVSIDVNGKKRIGLFLKPAEEIENNINCK